MATLGAQLLLPRCPHCKVDTPSLVRAANLETKNFKGRGERSWATYICSRCGGVVLAGALKGSTEISEIYPSTSTVHEDIPDRAREYLQQALDSLHAPAGAVVLAASAVDSMLKAKGLKDGTLFSRIEAASKQGLITAEMAQWAHEVRLDANDQRHSDDSAPLPGPDDAQRVIEFAQALGMFLFVLPARVKRGLAAAGITGIKGSE